MPDKAEGDDAVFTWVAIITEPEVEGKIEGDAILDISDLDPKEREEICAKLGGVYDVERGRCLVKIKVDKANPKQIKILKFEID